MKKGGLATGHLFLFPFDTGEDGVADADLVACIYHSTRSNGGSIVNLSEATLAFTPKAMLKEPVALAMVESLFIPAFPPIKGRPQERPG